jgi:hypothetical protein
VVKMDSHLGYEETRIVYEEESTSLDNPILESDIK